jgi:hypothetical protein
MLSESALTSMNILFATPCYISSVTMSYVVSIFDLTREGSRLGLNFLNCQAQEQPLAKVPSKGGNPSHRWRWRRHPSPWRQYWGLQSGSTTDIWPGLWQRSPLNWRGEKGAACAPLFLSPGVGSLSRKR